MVAGGRSSSLNCSSFGQAWVHSWVIYTLIIPLCGSRRQYKCERGVVYVRTYGWFGYVHCISVTEISLMGFSVLPAGFFCRWKLTFCVVKRFALLFHVSINSSSVICVDVLTANAMRWSRLKMNWGSHCTTAAKFWHDSTGTLLLHHEKDLGLPDCQWLGGLVVGQQTYDSRGLGFGEALL